jgi:hypothetical protein
MKITLQEIMREILEYQNMYGDLMTANAKGNDEFKKAFKESMAKYNKIRGVIIKFKEQANDN